MLSIAGYGRWSGRRCLLALALGLLFFGWELPKAAAQDLFGIGNPGSPYIFFSGIEGEARITPIWMQVSSGKQTVPAIGAVWHLRDTFAIRQGHFFLDTMLKVGARRIFARTHYEPREFVGNTNFMNSPFASEAQARLEYSGLRIGGDVDLLRRFGAVAGIDIDYDLYRPVFSESIRTPGGGKKIEGPNALTVGFHFGYGRLISPYGLAVVCDGRSRWSVSGTQVNDYEIGGGLRGPDSMLGAWAVKFGYRQTSLEFPRPQMFSGLAVSTHFEAVMSGWYVQFNFFY